MTSNLANRYSNSAVVTATIPVAVADVLSPSQCKTFLNGENYSCKILIQT